MPFKRLLNGLLKAVSRPYQDHLGGLDKAHQDHLVLRPVKGFKTLFFIRTFEEALKGLIKLFRAL